MDILRSAFGCFSETASFHWLYEIPNETSLRRQRNGKLLGSKPLILCRLSENKYKQGTYDYESEGQACGFDMVSHFSQSHWAIEKYTSTFPIYRKPVPQSRTGTDKTALARNSFSGTIQQIRSIGFQEGYVSSSTALFTRCGAGSLPPISLVFWLVVTRGAGCVFNAALLSPCR